VLQGPACEGDGSAGRPSVIIGSARRVFLTRLAERPLRPVPDVQDADRIGFAVAIGIREREEDLICRSPVPVQQPPDLAVERWRSCVRIVVPVTPR
jgi:hypothetical protein